MAGKSFDFVNMSGKFQEIPQTGYLLQDLGIFKTVTNDNITVTADRLDDSQKQLTKAVARFGTDLSSIYIPKASNYSIPTVLRHTASTVTAADWQGKRAPGEDRQMTAADVVFTHMRKHQQVAADDREQVLAECLFNNTVTREDGENTLDYQAFWDVDSQGNQMTQQNFTLDAGPTGFAIASLEQAKTQLKSKMGGWRNRVQGYYLFAGIDLFYGIMQSPDVQQAVLYSKVGADAMFPATLSGYESFKLGNVTVILDDSDLHAGYIDSSIGFLVPRFGGVVEGSIAPFTMFNCPASRHMLAASGPVYGEYHYQYHDEWMNTRVMCESSYAPVQFRPDWIMKLNYSAQ